ncbi:MAG: hypothetical protein ACHQD9_08185 [Chitinophagales bacterium]
MKPLPEFCKAVLLLGFISSILFIASCKKDSTEPLAIDESYFPLITGKYIIFDVDSVGYNSFDNTTKTSIYQIMEEVDSPYIDNAGNQAFKIIRSRRANADSAWIATDVWSANLTDHTAEKVEENLRFVKLDFPIELNREWYGNAYIQTDSPLQYLSGWQYKYTAVHQPLLINGNSFDSTVTVSQHDDENVIEQTIYTEKYAKHVGLIYKLEEQLSTQPGQSPDGFIITMQVNSFN